MATKQQTYTVTLLNVGGDNNDPLEYFACVPEDAKQVMKKIIEGAVKGDESSGLKEQVVKYNKILYTQWKSGLREGENPFTGYDFTDLSVIPKEMPDIKSRFRSAIRQKTVFNKDTFPVIMKAISGIAPPESRGNLPGEINDLITGHLDNNKDLFNKSVDKNLEKYMRDESEAIKVLVNFSEQPDYSKIKQKDFFRLGAIFEIYVHIVTLFEGYHTLQKVEKQKVQNFIDNYESISSNILALKQNAIVNLLSKGNNNIVLLNECTTKADEVNPYKFAVKKGNEPLETYSAICVSSDLDLDYDDDFVAVISNYIRDNHPDWVAEFAVSKITKTYLYFVCIHCNSFKNDEDRDDAKKNERSIKIGELIRGLANFTMDEQKKKQIILGIDTNTGTFQSTELLTAKLLAPLEMNEIGQVQNGVSSNQYFTVNKERSFYNPQISKAGELEKKTKDIILGIGFKETNNQPQILNYNGSDWEAVKPTENTMAPNMTNPFDHFAVRFNFNYKGQPVPPPHSPPPLPSGVRDIETQTGGTLETTRDNGNCFFESLSKALNSVETDVDFEDRDINSFKDLESGITYMRTNFADSDSAKDLYKIQIESILAADEKEKTHQESFRDALQKFKTYITEYLTSHPDTADQPAVADQPDAADEPDAPVYAVVNSEFKKKRAAHKNAIIKYKLDITNSIRTNFTNTIPNQDNAVLTFEHFKDYLKSSEFWANEAVIEHFRQKLNLEIIVITQNDDSSLSMTCGNHLDNLSGFVILALIETQDDEGNKPAHYQPLFFGGNGVLKQIPQSVEQIIQTKCNAGNALLKYLSSE